MSKINWLFCKTVLLAVAVLVACLMAAMATAKYFQDLFITLPVAWVLGWCTNIAIRQLILDYWQDKAVLRVDEDIEYFKTKTRRIEEILEREKHSNQH